MQHIDNMRRLASVLRSNKYKQGRGALRNENDEFCCLGVYRNETNPEGWKSSIKKDELGNDRLVWSPYEEVDIYGDADPTGYLSYDGAMELFGPDMTRSLGRMYALARLNDDGYSFGQIAQILDGFADDDSIFAHVSLMTMLKESK